MTPTFRYAQRMGTRDACVWGALGPSLLAAATLVGCSYTYVPCRVTVIDAETAEPLSGVDVSVFYGRWPWGPFVSPADDRGVTDENGAVTLRVTASDEREAWPMWNANPQGYHDSTDGGEGRATTEQIRRLIATGSENQIATLTFRRWAEPGPTVLVTVPTGYRGFIRVCEPTATPPTPEARLRLFECAADERGVCTLPAASILTEAQEPVVFSFQFADGSELPEGPRAPLEGGDLVAAWALWYVDSCRVFVIGTEHEAWRERKALWPDGVLDNSTYDRFATRVRAGPFPPE
jgi:hypothetical protein